MHRRSLFITTCYCYSRLTLTIVFSSLLDVDFDKDDIVAWGESFGDGHPSSVKFTNDRQQEAVCSLTKALVLMMKDSCLYSRWKRTLEIGAFYFMEGFIEGKDIDMNLSKCIDTPKEPKGRNRDDGDDDKYDRKKRKNPRQL
mmetsp:Transcript_32241/g.65517  ORF Transcript_32241/g.65517 Transcript_32241/m.65517 type:complete len:142 (+) Transcript_32241:542-967(+)